MSITVTTLANELATEMGEEYNDLDVSEQYITWVKEVVRQVYASGRWNSANAVETVSLATDTATYTLASTTSEVKSVRLPATDAVVVYTPVERLISRGKDLESSGLPTNWWYDGLDTGTELKIRVWPVPSASENGVVLQLWSQKRPPILGDSDTIPLPDEFVDVCRDGVRSKARAAENNLDGAMLAKQDYIQGLQLLGARFQAPPKIGSTMASKRKLRAIHQAPASGNDGG